MCGTRPRERRRGDGRTHVIRRFVTACSVYLVLVGTPLSVAAQIVTVASAGAESRSARTALAVRTPVPIVLDGIVDSVEWAGATRNGAFHQYFPFDTSASVSISEFRVMYDDENLYVAAILRDTLGTTYVSPSLRRDYRGSANDGLTVVLDPWQDGTTGVFFGVNPYNVQREGLVVNGGADGDDFDRSWDNVWSSATHIAEGYWSVEMVIPFKALRFRDGDRTWGINVYRIDSKYNERSIWNRVPRQFQLYNLAYLGELEWEEPMSARGAGVTLLPYTAANASRDFTSADAGTRGGDAGLDAKIALTRSLNLDLTYNPDFSQVEVDEQQTNLDRFELFFPERRQFFLENADLFSGFGFDNARPFFSRRIGVAIDSSTGQNVQNRILGGARVSGRLNDDWRVGLLTMQGAADDARGIDPRNYTMIAAQRQLFARSNIALLAVGQQNTRGAPLDATRANDGSANRLLGADYNLASADGAWTGKVFLHHNVADGADAQAYSHGAFVQRSTLRWRAAWLHQLVGDGFDARTGFVPRRGFQRVRPELEMSVFPAGSLVNRFVFRVDSDLTWSDPRGLTDRTISGRWATEFRSTARFDLTARSRYVELFAPFSPVRGATRVFEAGEQFEQPELEASFSTDTRRVVNGTARLRAGRYFNGSLRQTSGALNYRWRQYATGALTWNVSQIDLAPGYDDATLWLVGSRVDITLTTRLFWTTFTQYNNQFDNLNVNSRLQWRFLPASDLFVVYTENYIPNSLRPKNRALLAKLSWWVNL